MYVSYKFLSCLHTGMSSWFMLSSWSNSWFWSVCIRHRWGDEMGSFQHKSPHQARTFRRGLMGWRVLRSAYFAVPNYAVCIFSYEYLLKAEKSNWAVKRFGGRECEMGWSRHMSHSESQQREFENAGYSILTAQDNDGFLDELDSGGFILHPYIAWLNTWSLRQGDANVAQASLPSGSPCTSWSYGPDRRRLPIHDLTLHSSSAVCGKLSDGSDHIGAAEELLPTSLVEIHEELRKSYKWEPKYIFPNGDDTLTTRRTYAIVVGKTRYSIVRRTPTCFMRCWYARLRLAVCIRYQCAMNTLICTVLFHGPCSAWA